MKLARAEQMREIDRAAIFDVGIPGVVLMENAGRKTACLLWKRFGPLWGKNIVVFAGPGNNGGDGFVVARHLQEKGAQVTVYLLVEREKISGDAAVNLAIIDALGVPVHTLPDSTAVNRVDSSGWAVIVDALFGTGLKREVTGHFAGVIDLINRASCPVVAVDMPSGIDSDTGSILGSAVRAELTVTYGLAKPGHFVYPGRELAGNLEVVDIGIPRQVVDRAGLQCEVLDEETVRPFIPRRPGNSHKGTFGHLLLAAGSQGKTGAALLAAQGGLRSGAGLVSLCVGKKLNPIFEAALFEAMTIPVTGGPDGAPAFADYEEIVAAMQGKQAMVIGPGLGMDDGTTQLVRQIFRHAPLPLVVDADGLNALAAEPSVLHGDTSAARILTPHPGEMARLVGATGSAIQQNRIKAAMELAANAKSFVILKGAGTIVAAPDGRVAVNSSGNPGMAAGGMGDVLSGLIGGLLAQGAPPWEACCLAVFVHGRAADELAGEMGSGFLAGEVAARIPAVINKLLTQASGKDVPRLCQI